MRPGPPHKFLDEHGKKGLYRRRASTTDAYQYYLHNLFHKREHYFFKAEHIVLVVTFVFFLKHLIRLSVSEKPRISATIEPLREARANRQVTNLSPDSVSSTIDASTATMIYKKNGIITIEQRRPSESTSSPSNDSSNKAFNPFMLPIPSSTSVPSSSRRRGSDDAVLSIIDAALSILEPDDIVDSGSTEQTRQ